MGKATNECTWQKPMGGAAAMCRKLIAFAAVVVGCGSSDVQTIAQAMTCRLCMDAAVGNEMGKNS